MLPIRRILVPVNFTDACRTAALFASDLASRIDADLCFVHVLEPASSATGFETATVFEATMQAMRAHARQCLDSFVNLNGSKPPDRVLLEGDAATEIVRLAHSERVDLILMPTHGYGIFRRLLLGSVTAKVLHDCNCPVWTGVHPEAYDAAGRIGIDRICCAVDLGPQTASALRWALQCASHWKARLDVVHVVAPVLDDSVREHLVRIARDQLLSLQSEIGFEAELHVEPGEVRRAVPELATRLGAHLLVIARGHAAQARLGGGAYAIIRDSGMPVVSV